MFNALKNLFRHRRAERDLEAEVRGYAQLLEEENVSRGMQPDQARREARLELGGTEQLKEEVRTVRAGAWIEALLRDFRIGARMLSKSPGFFAVAVITLALGIGANTAIFSVLESQLWRPLPFPDSEQLVDVHAVRADNPRQWDVVSTRVFDAWRKESKSFENLSGYDYPEPRNLTANGTSARVMVMPITANFFDTLKLAPQQGRAVRPDEEIPNGPRVAVISDATWHSQFAADPSLVGKSVVLDGEPFLVVGIAPAKLHFEYIDEPAVYVPLEIDLSTTSAMRHTYSIGRLASGVGITRARAELDGILKRELVAEGAPTELAAAVTNLRENWTSFAARPLYFFAGAIGLVLLIACVNTAGLLLARGLSRQREFSVRAALGASRGTLMRQSLVESLMLTLCGGAAGILVGVWGAKAFAAFIPADALPRNTEIVLDARVLLFTLAISIVSALLLGLAPAVFASRTDLNEVLRQSTRSITGSGGQNRARSTLVVVEVALAFVLLFGAGLFLSTFLHEADSPRGFDAPGVLTFRVALRGKNYAKPEQVQRYYANLVEKLRAVPGATSVGLGTGLPLTGPGDDKSIKLAGQPPKGKYGFAVMLRDVTPNYFQTFHIRFLAGREFDQRDTSSSVRVAIINHNFAQQFFGNDDPLGKILEFMPDRTGAKPSDAPVQIVGVTENTQDFGAMELPFADLYLPFEQSPSPVAFVALHSDASAAALAGPAREAAYAVDKDQPIFDLNTMEDRVAQSVKGARFNLYMVAGLAVVAIALVGVGIFGTIAYFVQQRTQEFGIRMALGASSSGILRLAIGQSLAMGLSGLAVGVAGALVIGRLIGHSLYLVPHEHSGMLYGVSIYDPLTMSIAGGLLVGVLLAASYVPVRRAMRVDPMIALRYE